MIRKDLLNAAAASNQYELHLCPACRADHIVYMQGEHVGMERGVGTDFAECRMCFFSWEEVRIPQQVGDDVVWRARVRITS